MAITVSKINVKSKPYGAKGNGSHDDTFAFEKALSDLYEYIDKNKTPGYNIQSAILYIPSGVYVIKKPLIISNALTIQGDGMYSTYLEFHKEPTTQRCAGIIIDTPQAGYSTIKDLAITGKTPWINHCPIDPAFPDDLKNNGYTMENNDFPEDNSNSGIISYFSVNVENCFITWFEHDGIHINTSVQNREIRKNANHWRITNARVEGNGRHGLFVSGGDSQAGLAIGVNSRGNCRWGIWEQGCLGNVYVGCYAENNVKGAFSNQEKVLKGQAPEIIGSYFSTLIGFMCESGNTVKINPSTAIFGFNGNSETGEWINGAQYKKPLILKNNGDAFFNNVDIFNSIKYDVAIDTLITSDWGKRNLFFYRALYGDVLITLPPLCDTDGNPVTEYTNKPITLKKIEGSYSLVIQGNNPSQEKIEGKDDVILSELYSWVTVIAVNNQWYIIGSG